MIFCFVDIGGIVNHHCLKFLNNILFLIYIIGILFLIYIIGILFLIYIIGIHFFYFSTIEITQLTGKDNEQLVGNVGQGPQSMV
jgi:hypothetical protein